MIVLNYFLNRLLRRPGPILTVSLIVALSVGTVLVSASTALSLRRAQAASENALASLGADIVAVRKVDEAAADASAVAVDDLSEGTHTRTLSRYRKTSKETSSSTVLSFSSFGVPTSLGGTISEEQVEAIAKMRGVSKASGILTASYCSSEEEQKKVVIAGEKIRPNPISLDPEEFARIEKQANNDSVYKRYANEQRAIASKGEQSMTAADFARMTELSRLLSDRKMELYRKWRPDIFGTAPRRSAKVVQPPPPVVRTEEYNVCGVVPGAGYMSAKDITSGRYLTNADMHENLAVLRDDFAAAKGLEPGDRIELLGLWYSVIGTGMPRLGAAAPQIYVPLPTLQKGIAAEGVVNTVFIRADSAREIPSIRAQLVRAIPDVKLSEDSDLSKVLHPSLTGAVRVVDRVGMLLAVLLAASSIISVTVMSGMTAAKRSREVATLRALGWPTRAVIACLAAEGLFAVVAGALVGLAGGMMVLARLTGGDHASGYQMYTSTYLFGHLAGVESPQSLGSAVTVAASAGSIILALSVAIALCTIAILLTVNRVTRTQPSVVFAGR